MDNSLTHHGIKGMRWGIRRYQNADGSLTAAGKKKYAQKGFAQDAYNNNKSKAGKVYDRLTDAHKITGKMQYDRSSDRQRTRRANQYAKELATKKKESAEKREAAVDKVRKSSHTAAVILPSKENYSTAQVLGSTALALMGSQTVAAIARDVAYSYGKDQVARYIEAGSKITTAAIIGGAAGKTIKAGIRESKEQYEQTQKMMRRR